LPAANDVETCCLALPKIKATVINKLKEMKKNNLNPVCSFYKTARKKPANLALWVDGLSYTYGELASQASQVAEWLQRKTSGPAKRVAIFASRGFGAYLGILGTCWAGAGYVPLNPAFPEKRLLKIIMLAEPDALIIDTECLTLLTRDILALFQDRILLINSNSTTVYGMNIEGHEQLAFFAGIEEPVEVGPGSEAYLVFTSGTTGTPNAVEINAGNLSFAIRTFLTDYPITENDRFSQFFEISFDFSIMDIFVPWHVGASTHVVPASQKLGPGGFITDQQLTVWTCVPSMISIMSEMNMLRPGLFPSLRFSCFSGAPLTAKAAQIWQETAPNSTIINLYGQTEAPIGSMAKNYNPSAAGTLKTKYIAIGKPFTGIYAAILGEDGKFSNTGIPGELILSGPHITNGYLNNPGSTAKKFKIIEHPRYGLHTWYLTGDLVRQDDDGTFHFMGRTDNEVKISGHRIMLEEVEHFLHEITGYGEVAIIIWYNHLDVPEALIGFVVGERLDEPAVKKSMGQILPRPLVPRRIFAINKLPLNPNGKIDRKALGEIAGKKISL